jgi:hypothetical protein
MKQCTGNYKYKGFLINFSEYTQSWRLEPTLELIGDNSDVAIDFAVECNNDSMEFRTINQAKKYIKDNYDILISEIKKSYEDFR